MPLNSCDLPLSRCDPPLKSVADVRFIPKALIGRHRGQAGPGRSRPYQGWDEVREQTLARQKDVGVVPQDAVLTARPEEIPAWDDLPADLKSVLARQMEVYAGFLEHTDHHVGRLVDALAELEISRRHADLRDHRRQRRLAEGR